MKKKILEKNKGITLIALVITIIVLLILAGISISMLAGDNSLLKKAGEAKDKTELESLKEEAKIVMSNRTIEKTTMGTNSKTLKQDLESGISGVQVEEITKADGTTKYTDVCYVSKNGQSITVYEDGEVSEGKVSIWKGATDIECPEFKKDERNIWNWYIYTAGQLKFLADFVNNGNSLNGTENGADLTNYVTEANYDPSTVTMTTDTTVYLMNNLDLGARVGVGTTEEEKWETVANEQKKWIPIGIDSNNVKDKLGLFNGNNNSIKGLYVKNNYSLNGLFGSSETIRNLTVKKSYVYGESTSGGTGGIVGMSYGTIQNCNNENTIVISNRGCGGIVGFASGNVEKCTNKGIVKGNGVITGGILAGMSSSSKISECINYGAVRGKSTYVGGIIGFAARENITIEKCNNSGEIEGETSLTGGIVGSDRGKSIIYECINNGNVKSKGRRTGGIIGQLAMNSTTKDCINNGMVVGNDEHVGGIAGISFGKIEKCNNVGNISVVQGNRVGGITGESQGDISACNNNSIVEVNGDNIGGIVGKLDYSSKVENCNNSGQVIGIGDYIGGIVGVIHSDGNDPSDKEPATVSKCYNSGNVQGKDDTGGIIGGACQYKSLIEKCYNVGEVNGTGNTTGGIAGTFGRSSRIYNCYNMNKVKGVENVGGIAGYSYVSSCEIRNCYNIGKISGATNLGGIVGKNNNSSTIENSYYLEGTANLDEGSGSANNLAKNKEFITQDFVTTANATETIWKVESGKNDGWPILNE